MPSPRQQVLRPDAMMQKLGGFWAHKHWKVRHGLLQYVAEAISTIGEAVLVQPRDEGAWVLHRVIMLVSDPERCANSVRGVRHVVCSMHAEFRPPPTPYPPIPHPV